MALTAGIVGLPNVGKSTLFNAITKAGALAANYPFATIEPNVGMVEVPDERLDVLTKMYNPKKSTRAVCEFTDIAGLVKGASKGEGLGNQFLGNIRNCDAILEVVRCFEDGNITHVEGTVDPVRDAEIIQLELILSDLESVDKRIVKIEKKAQSKVDDAPFEFELLKKIKTTLEKELPVRSLEFNETELPYLKNYGLLQQSLLCWLRILKSPLSQIQKRIAYIRSLKPMLKKQILKLLEFQLKLNLSWLFLRKRIKQCFWQIWA